MRKIEFRPSVSGLTKIFVDGKELDTKLDPKSLKLFVANKSKLPPSAAQNILNTLSKNLENEVINLAKDEVSFITNYVKTELNL